MFCRIPCVIVIVSLCSACAPAVRMRSVPALPLSQSDPAQGVSVAPGTRVAIYLNNGRRVEHTPRLPVDLASLMTIDGMKSDDVVALTAVPRDRLLDGVLVGSAAGVGTALGWAHHLAEGDFSGEIVGAAAAYGAAAGAGVGALLDAGIATPETPVWIRPAPGLSASSPKRLNFAVTANAVAEWIVGRKPELMLKDGSYWKGRILRGNENEIELDVSDSSVKGRRGRTERIRTDRLATLTYRENIGGNRVSAALGGALSGFFIGPLATTITGYDSADETPVVVGLGLGLALGTATGIGIAEHYNWREVTLSVK